MILVDTNILVGFARRRDGLPKHSPETTNLYQRDEFTHAHTRVSNQRTNRSRRNLPMLWYRKTRHHSGFDQNHMTSALAVLTPTRALESAHRFGTGDDGEFGHAIPRLPLRASRQ